MNGHNPLRRKMPWAFIAGALLATLIQCQDEWRGLLFYDRTAIAHGEWWRLWTGHLVHFGWPHFAIDTGLFLILGWLLESAQPALARLSLIALPVFISSCLFCYDPTLLRFGGLSAVNHGLLLYLIGQRWQQNRTGWFWPAVLFVYLGELVFMSAIGKGSSGGMIRFDDPEIHVATSAHLAGVIYAIMLLLGIAYLRWLSGIEHEGSCQRKVGRPS